VISFISTPTVSSHLKRNINFILIIQEIQQKGLYELSCFRSNLRKVEGLPQVFGTEGGNVIILFQGTGDSFGRSEGTGYNIYNLTEL